MREAKIKMRENLSKAKIVKIRDINLGDGKPILIAGPCSIESRDHIIDEAKDLKRFGVDIVRGGAFKPRTSPFDFQGLGFEAVKYSVSYTHLTLPTNREV